MQKITPFLWFDGKAEEAANYYVSVFKNSGITDTNPMMTSFVLEGQPFIALNGGPEFTFTEAVSFFVNCQSQEEVDYYWDRLIEDGGEASQCGWLKDKYGLSWQIIPKQLGELMGSSDRQKADRVMQTMRKMKKIIVADLVAAYELK